VDPTVVTVVKQFQAENLFFVELLELLKEISTSCILNWSIPTSMKILPWALASTNVFRGKLKERLE
jgi:hypothetical protein